MKFKITRLLSLFMVMFTICVPTMASSYYSKATATAVGEGKVYVSYKSESKAPNYATESSAESGKDSQSSAPTHKYFLYAQVSEGYEFVGWFDNSQCAGKALSTNLSYSVSFKAVSEDANSPTTQSYYAKFKMAGVPTLTYETSHVYLNLSDGTYKNESLVTENVVEAITYESSNANVATVAADGTVTAINNGYCVITAKSGVGEGTYIITVIDDVTAGITQIGNGDFEDWRGVTSKNHAPDNWNSFETGEGSLASFSNAQQVQMVEDHRPGSNGFYCANIWSRSVLGVVAQGNLTVGCINAGAATASDKANYNYSKTSDSKKSETLSKVPTAIRFWAKFVPAAVNAQHPNAHMEAVVHDNTNYITYSSPSYESAAEKAHVIAKARKDFPTTNGEWVEFTAPFELTGNAADGQLYIIVNLATNADPGQGQEGDQLYIDDVELLYDTEYDEVPVVKSEAKYGTFCAPFDVNVPYGMKAYTVQGVKADTSLDMTAVEGTIPANTPVILEGDGAKSLVAYGVAAPAVAEAGLLTGVYADTEAPVGSYVLQNIDDKVGFYQVAAGQQPTVKANRAYLTVAVPNAKVFYFTAEDAEEATGIENVNVNGNVNDGAVYNMAGQKVNKAVKGIYIINGKKVLK
ncbi:MAG: Ig-like domain-containing protein [Bacteroidaceae bacterium]|nr:Ig-like domain-containing protein [Bacteroidaceae bacterium]